MLNKFPNIGLLFPSFPKNLYVLNKKRIARKV